jgi:hypothetical protein
MRLDAPPDRIFPLLCPVREYDWIPTWSCDMIYSESGVAENDCVFATAFPEEGPRESWVVVRYEPPLASNSCGFRTPTGSSGTPSASGRTAARRISTGRRP